MTPQSLKEEVLKEFDERFREEYRKVYSGFLPDEIIDKGNPWFESLLSSAIDKAYAAGKQEGIREEGTPTKNSSGRYQLGYKDGYAAGREDACNQIQLGLYGAPDGEKTMGWDAFEGDFVRDLVESARTNNPTDTV